MSSAIASRLSGRSISAVRPWACKSTAITCRAFESAGRISANMSVAPTPPCSRISGCPVPWIS